MRFSELISRFYNKGILWEVSCGADRELHSVTLIEGTEELYYPSILYFGYPAQMGASYPPQLILIGTEEDAVRLREHYSNGDTCLAVVSQEHFGRVFNQCREQVEYTFELGKQEKIANLYRSIPEDMELCMAYCIPTAHPELFPDAEVFREELGRRLRYVYVFNAQRGVVLVGDTKALRHDMVMLSVVPEACRLRVGISNVITHENRVKAAYNEAVEAFDIGRRVWPEDQIYPFAEVGIFNLLRDAAERNELNRYLSPSLLKLQEYDQKMGTHLLETLHVYLRENGSIKDTASRMYLHRNTVIYRLNKIRQITNLDIDTAKIRFILLLSFAAITVREKFV